MRRIFKQIPFARQTYQYFQELEYERKFAGDCHGCFRGVYETFEEAIQSVPNTNKSIGYDNAELAEEYQQGIDLETTAHSYNYPILFWLNSIFNNYQDNLNIFDFGGNVGIHFYTYSNYLKYPSNLNWIVCDLPAIIKAGKELAEQQGCSNLFFTDQFEDANKQDIFLASGSIQYVEDLSESLASLTEKPQHLLLNILPLYDGAKFVTLQNGGKVFYPSYVFNKANFIEGLNRIGYEMIDIWKDSYSLFTIPFHPEKSGSFFHGIYFKLKSQ